MRSRSDAAILGRRSTVIFTGLSLSIALGLALQMFLASHLGTSQLADVFFLGVAIPTLVATATLGSTSSALIRDATEVPHTIDPRAPGGPGRAVLLLSLAATGVMSCVGGLFATGLLGYSSSEADREFGRFLLLTSVIPTLVAFAALGAVLALAQGHFVRAAWGATVNGAALLVLIVVMSGSGLSATKLALSVDLAYVAQVVFVLPAFRGIGSAIGTTEHARTRAATRAVLLLIGAAALYKSQPFVERVVGAAVGSGVPAALGYADKVVQGLAQLAVFGFALASLPSFAREMAAGDHPAASIRLRATFTATLTATLIVLMFGLTSSDEIVRVLYERGQFSPAAAELTRSLVLCALPSVLFGALASPLVAVAYANSRVVDVVKIGVQGFLLSVAATVGLAYLLGARGIVLGTGCGFAFTFCRFATGIRSMLPGWSWKKFVRGYALTGVATLAAICAAAVLAGFLPVAGVHSTPAALALLSARLLLLALAGFGALWAHSRFSAARRDRTAALASQGGRW